eukprot:TRINITY_DN49039_c0_g1_i1.p1 TRINITY_DN49039_c0_g1~~TRINITY_DN49039_c0_g1_i1.p1  ORF type:complete len:417 (-),score=75.45 TRINITY_DN49039_c0_g1_i1:36-1286(-)
MGDVCLCAGDLSASVEIATTVNSVVARWTLRLVASSAVTHVGRGDAEAVTVVAIASLKGCRGLPQKVVWKRHVVVASVVSDGGLQAEGVTEFHFLHPSQKHVFTLEVNDESPASADGASDSDAAAIDARRLLVQRDVKTLGSGSSVPSQIRCRIPPQMWLTYVGEEHDLGEWLGDCPEDTVWAFAPTFELMRSLWINACFTLPTPRNPATTCPNPKQRYCLDLTKGAPWLKSKKVKRHKDDFRLTVNSNFIQTFWDVERTHREDCRGTWITEELVSALDRCRRSDEELRVYSVELWEKKTGKLAAAIMSFSVGDIFHDYSTSTMIRDNRSAGALLTKVVGHLLVRCGYTLWYWGFKNSYMAEYDGQYGGGLWDNKADFWPRWRIARERARTAPCDLATVVPCGDGANGGGLDLATL